MEGNSSKKDTLVLNEWLEENFNQPYISCIKINGQPLLPPLMSLEQRCEARRLRAQAIQVEERLSKKKQFQGNEDWAGGEALYEDGTEDFHFGISTASFTQNVDDDSKNSPAKDSETHSKSRAESSTLVTEEILKQFDPLESDQSNIGKINSDSEKFPAPSDDCNASKQSSEGSSITLSRSTDLNNYFDVNERLVDSFPINSRSDVSDKMVGTSNFYQFKSDDDRSVGSCSLTTEVPYQNKPTTFEDLNNFLDLLLNNSNESSNEKTNSSPVFGKVEDLSKHESGPTEGRKSSDFKIDAPPLTEPKDSLQTKQASIQRCESDKEDDWTQIPSDKKDPVLVNEDMTTSNFLEQCELSPVRHVRCPSRLQEENLKLYFQNIVSGQITLGTFPQRSSAPQSLIEEGEFEDVLSSQLLVAEVKSNNEAGGSTIDTVVTAPRLVRSNSYTLDSPSPLLLAHMEAEMKQRAALRPKHKFLPKERPSSTGYQRNSDSDKNKSNSGWSNKQSSFSKSSGVRATPKKNLPSHVIGKKVENRSVLGKSAKANSSPSKNSAKIKKVVETLPSEVKAAPAAVESSPGSVLVDFPKDIMSKESLQTLLEQIQLQHTREIEELLKRQKQEQEAIRIALLERSELLFMQIGDQGSHSTQTAKVFDHDEQDESVQTTSNVLLSPRENPQLERRNTSPSIYEQNKNSNGLETLVEYHKCSSVSLDDISSQIPHLALPNDESSIEGSRPQSDFSSASALAFGNESGSKSYPFIEGNNMSMIERSLNLTNNNGFPKSGAAPVDIMATSLPNKCLLMNNNTEPSDLPSSDSGIGTQSIMSSSFPSARIAEGQGKRRSWCIRQLFCDQNRNISDGNPEWTHHTQAKQRHLAAAKIQAGVRGYLTRRLLKTERVQACITTIRDTIMCALQLQHDCTPHVEASDLQLHGRLIQQLSAACEELHNIFIALPIAKRMAIITLDREWLRSRTPRSQSSSGYRPLSRATQIALRRKMIQNSHSDSSSISSSAPSSARQSRRRSWATVENRTRHSIGAPNTRESRSLVSTKN